MNACVTRAAPVITLDQLRVLDAIARTGSFTAAGRSLHRATSAISYAVGKLEESLGLELFDRAARRAQLTDAGARILDEARAVLARTARLEYVAGQLRDAWEPRLLVVLDGIFPLAPVMRAVRRFGEQTPSTRVELKVEFLAGVYERFVDDEGDLMLSLGVEGELPTLRSHGLPAIEVLLVAAAGHPLCDRSQRKTKEDLAEHVELTVADSSRAGSMRVAALGSPSVVRLSDFHAKREALLSGVGFGWLPRHLADELLASGRLAVIPFEEGFRRRFAPRLVHRQGNLLGRGAARMVALLVEELEAHTRRGRLR